MAGNTGICCICHLNMEFAHENFRGPGKNLWGPGKDLKIMGKSGKIVGEKYLFIRKSKTNDETNEIYIAD
jgi:hypothetical protein